MSDKTPEKCPWCEKPGKPICFGEGREYECGSTALCRSDLGEPTREQSTACKDLELDILRNKLARADELAEAVKAFRDHDNPTAYRNMIAKLAAYEAGTKGGG